MSSEERISLAFVELHPEDAARVLERLDATAAADFLVQIPAPQAASVLRCSTSSNASRWLELCTPAASAQILGVLPLDLASALLRSLDQSRCADILAAIPDEVEEPLRQLLRFPQGSAGALSDPRVLAVAADATIGEAIEEVRRSPHQAIYYLYLVERDRTLVGVMNLRELLLSPPEDAVSQWMNTNVVSLAAQDDKNTFANHPGWRRFHALPVVDERQSFLGAIRHETLIRLRESLAEGGLPTAGSTAGSALGELYWLGLTGVLQALGSTLTAGRDPEP